MTIEFLKSDFDKVSYFLNLLVAHATGQPADSVEYETLRRDLLTNPRLADALPSWVRTHRDLGSFWGFIQPKFAKYAERRTYLSEQFTPLLDELEFDHLSPTEKPSGKLKPKNSTAVARNKRKVFIVHGHDNEAKHEVARFLEQLSIEPIILHEQASAGKTIIEKIEHYSNDADFALVLYTPCDRGRGALETTIPAKNRARQNVVFEHGYLMAKFGRENVCALVKGEIEIPNDTSGVVFVGLDVAGAWKLEIIKELKAAGYSISQ